MAPIIQHKDIFSYEGENNFLVNPTNIGWKKSGHNVMGAGLAKHLSKKYPELSLRYGRWCQLMLDRIYVDMQYNIICAPSKPLNGPEPWMSWQNKSDYGTIEQSYEQLYKLADIWACNSHFNYNIISPLLGTGNGGLPKSHIIAIINNFDWPENVIFVDKNK